MNAFIQTHVYSRPLLERAWNSTVNQRLITIYQRHVWIIPAPRLAVRIVQQLYGTNLYCGAKSGRFWDRGEIHHRSGRRSGSDS